MPTHWSDDYATPASVPVFDDASVFGDEGIPLLELRDAVVRRDGRDILSVSEFKVDRGDQIAILGPNGAGKSTFIKLLTREMAPLWRENPPLLFCGDPRPELAKVRRILGVVSTTMQDEITIHMSCLQIVLGGFFGSLGVPARYEVTKAQRTIAYERLVELGAGTLAERDIRTLSTGQARRVLFARALVNNPSVVVLDEPCNGLDPEGTWNVRQALSAMAQTGRTVLLVTHLVEDIRPEFNRVLLIEDGLIVDDGPKTNVLTTDKMRKLFGVPVSISEHGGLYHLW
jgi:iron complex transport system ATP-binding protein